MVRAALFPIRGCIRRSARIRIRMRGAAIAAAPSGVAAMLARAFSWRGIRVLAQARRAPTRAHCLVVLAFALLRASVSLWRALLVALGALAICRTLTCRGLSRTAATAVLGRSRFRIRLRVASYGASGLFFRGSGSFSACMSACGINALRARRSLAVLNSRRRLAFIAP